MNLVKFRADLVKWESVGLLETTNGLFYGKDVNGNLNGSFHIVFAPNDNTSIKVAKEQFPRLAQFDYANSLEESNGAQLFEDCFYLLSVDALGVKYDFGAPYKLWAVNHSFRSLCESFDGLIIGGGNLGNMAVVYIQLRNGSILAVDRDNGAQKFGWECLDNLVVHETRRLGKFFDANGRRSRIDQIADYET